MSAVASSNQNISQVPPNNPTHTKSRANPVVKIIPNSSFKVANQTCAVGVLDGKLVVVKHKVNGSGYEIEFKTDINSSGKGPDDVRRAREALTKRNEAALKASRPSQTIKAKPGSIETKTIVPLNTTSSAEFVKKETKTTVSNGLTIKTTIGGVKLEAGTTQNGRSVVGGSSIDIKAQTGKTKFTLTPKIAGPLDQLPSFTVGGEIRTPVAPSTEIILKGKTGHIPEATLSVETTFRGGAKFGAAVDLNQKIEINLELPNSGKVTASDTGIGVQVNIQP